MKKLILAMLIVVNTFAIGNTGPPNQVEEIPATGCHQQWDDAEKDYVIFGPMAWWLSYALATEQCPRADYIQAEQFCNMNGWMYEDDEDCMNHVLNF